MTKYNNQYLYNEKSVVYKKSQMLSNGLYTRYLFRPCKSVSKTKLEVYPRVVAGIANKLELS
jgi:hypothetical protein